MSVSMSVSIVRVSDGLSVLISPAPCGLSAGCQRAVSGLIQHQRAVSGLSAG
jgi:hypothetical protein